MTYLQGVTNPYKLLIEFAIFSWVNNYITYKLAIEWNLSWQILIAYLVSILVGTTLVAPYIYPLQILQSIREDLSNIQLFGIAIFGASTLFVSVFVLAQRFGWMYALAISFGISTLAGTILAASKKLDYAHLNPDSIIHS
jgi:hypothetical protein